MARIRFEEGLEILCCGLPTQRLGNYSLREAGAPCTQLGYRCQKCHREIVVADAPYGGIRIPQSVLDDTDATS